MNPTDQHPAVPPDDAKLSLVEIINPVLRHWRLVAILPVAFALVAGVRSLSQDRSYVVTASFMPQVAEGRAGGGAAALAQQFGVSLGTERPGQTPQFYVDLLRSRKLLRQTVESEYQLPTDDGRVWSGTLIEYWELDDGSGPRPPWRQATERLRNAISASVTRETGVVQLTVSAGDPALAEAIAERLLELLNEFNLEVRQSRAQEEGRFISSRITEAQADLRAAAATLQEFVRQNRQFRSSPELVFEHDDLQREVLMRQEVYTSLLRSQEQARIDAVRDTPLFTVIDEPAGAADPQGRGTVRRAVLAFMLGLMMALFIAYATEFARRSRQPADPHYREFQGLAREAWDDLRHPARWLRRGEHRVAAGDH